MDFNNKKYQELAVGLNLNVFDLIRHYKLNGFISEEENGNLSKKRKKTPSSKIRMILRRR